MKELCRTAAEMIAFAALSLLILALLMISCPGCAGDSARVNVLGPAITHAWPSVRADAELGIAGRNESDGVKAQRLSRVHEFDAALAEFNRQNQGAP